MDSEGIRLFFQLILSGLIVGCIYASVALGFVLIYKATDIINFAQGEIFMTGAFFTWWFMTAFSVPFPVASLMGVMLATLLGVGIERVATAHSGMHRGLPWSSAFWACPFSCRTWRGLSGELSFRSLRWTSARSPA
jgi:branched-subunit amino acid ABC-type transport system permease component